MPGIVVGVDGSDHSQRALEWAAKEAGLRGTPLTVITVHQAAASIFGGKTQYPDDAARTQQAREAAQAETDKALARLGDSRPESVTVTAVHGFPVEELIQASEGADMLVIGQRGAGGVARLVIGSVAFQVVQHATSPVTIIPAKHGR